MKTSYTMLDPQSSQVNSPRGRCALGVMIKAPRAGASKTRLVPPLTHEEAARLSVAFLRDTAENIADACLEHSDGAVHAVAVYTPAGAEGAFDELLPPGFALLVQRGDAFGERLFHAAADLLRLGYESCCLIDSDSPTLPRALLTAAVEELRRPGDRLVLGPSDDGGYYLIGMKRAHPRLFEEIAWSTADVSKHTLERAREIDLEVKLLPAWYDVDDASTLCRLHDELFDAPGDAFDAPAGDDDKARGDDAHGDDDNKARGAKLVPYFASHTRAEVARLLDAEGRERILDGLAAARAREENGA
ncbi:MAG TPA: TIGR04282 family arsenosugar biosynthesis glycosyltransferase [Pyrinomonadaceae bacterium]|nr:TIGR04282 family arsenosugar biosynthesis glycosyltransferase [Pyrinomonadaceae bacterium]